MPYRKSIYTVNEPQIINLLSFSLTCKVYIASRSGHLSVWKCDTELDGLTPYTKPKMETDAKLVSDNEEEPEKKGWDEKTVKKPHNIFHRQKRKQS